MKHLAEFARRSGNQEQCAGLREHDGAPSARDHAAFLQCGGCVLLVEPRIDLERRAESREEIGVGVG